MDASVPAVVRGDPARVRQVLTNLVQNAIKFTEAGRISIRVSAIEGSESDVVLRYEVSDTGVGIEPGKRALIFEPFVQADSSTSRRYGGTGLGLTICHRLVTLMGGDCGVTSQLGTGSTFWFTVAVSADRVRKGDDPEPLGGPLAVNDRARMEGALASSRLLLAEDNLINQKVALSMLSDAGCQIDVVETGAAAVRAVEARRYDAILMDCQMPELNGFEATAAIRAHEIDSGRRTPSSASRQGRAARTASGASPGVWMAIWPNRCARTR